MLIIIRGDGTILRTIRKLGGQIPILGINFGRSDSSLTPRLKMRFP